jgi:uncharacterized protein (TIGR00251 family)
MPSRPSWPTRSPTPTRPSRPYDGRLAPRPAVGNDRGVADHADIRVRLTPRASREQIAAGADGAFAARVTAPPVDGRANEALCRLVAARAGVAASRVSVVRGAKARDKVVRVEGIEAADLRARLLAG